MQMTRARVLHTIRGQALLETALVLPMFLLVLFGVIWAVQTSTVGERAQIAVRFDGLVANEASPYNAYSLSALYNGLPGSATVPSIATCMSPVADAFTDTGQFSFPGMPGGTPSFFQPSAIPAGSCSRNVAILSGGSLAQPVVFIQTLSSVTAPVDTQSVLSTVLGPVTNLTASQNFFVTPDVPRLLACYPELGAAVAQSLTPTPVNALGAPAAISETPSNAPLSVNVSC